MDSKKNQTSNNFKSRQVFEQVSKEDGRLTRNESCLPIYRFPGPKEERRKIPDNKGCFPQKSHTESVNWKEKREKK